jgi:signal transduction histidine kinase
MATNGLGIMSNTLISPEIIISLPFYKSSWFILSLILLLSSILYYIYRLIQSKRRAAQKIRNQISRDLHDDLGSTLSGVKMYTQLAKNMLDNKEDVRTLIDEISDKTDDMIHTMSDIVWSINPDKDSLHDIMVRLKLYMTEVLESQNIEVHYTQNIDLKEVKISPDDRKNIYLMLKEIIHNASKHSRCKNFYFNVEFGGRVVNFLLKDDGIGFNSQSEYNGNGQKSIKERASALQAKIKISSSVNMGCEYNIHFKLE